MGPKCPVIHWQPVHSVPDLWPCACWDILQAPGNPAKDKLFRKEINVLIKK